MVDPPGNPIHTNLQIFQPSRNFSFLASFHGNSKTWALGCRKLKNVVHIREGIRKQILHGWLVKICPICLKKEHLPTLKFVSIFATCAEHWSVFTLDGIDVGWIQ